MGAPPIMADSTDELTKLILLLDSFDSYRNTLHVPSLTRSVSILVVRSPTAVIGRTRPCSSTKLGSGPANSMVISQIVDPRAETLPAICLPVSIRECCRP